MSTQLTHRDALALATRRLEDAAVPDAAEDALSLLAHVVGKRPAEAAIEDRVLLGDTAARTLSGLVERRAAREPLQHVLGSVGFHDVELVVDRRALVPRQATETLVDAVLGWLDKRGARQPRILDLGTGSGAIAVAIAAALRDGWIVASDVSLEAATLARANVARSIRAGSVSLMVGDWWAPFRPGAEFDVVVSNPPYVTTEEISSLEPEVRDHDPRLALDGGADGLAPYRVICAAAAGHLRSGGLLALEVAAERAEPVVELLSEANFQRIETRNDLDGWPRVVLGER